MALIEIDTPPVDYLTNAAFPSEFKRWLANIVDSIKQAFNGIKSAQSEIWAGGSASHAFIANGLLPTDIVVASILSSTNAVSIEAAVPTANTLTVTFTGDPGANTQINWIAIATV